MNILKIQHLKLNHRAVKYGVDEDNADKFINEMLLFSLFIARHAEEFETWALAEKHKEITMSKSTNQDDSRTKIQCEGWRRTGGMMTLGRPRWDQCTETAIVNLVLEQDGVTQTLPSCWNCWQEAIATPRIKITKDIPLIFPELRGGEKAKEAV